MRLHHSLFGIAVGKALVAPEGVQQNLYLTRYRFNYHSKGFSNGRAFLLATASKDEYCRHEALALPGVQGGWFALPDPGLYGQFQSRYYTVRSTDGSSLVLLPKPR